MAKKYLEQKYRFYLEQIGDFYVHVFESRYYAQKYLNEVVQQEKHSPGVFEYEIKLEEYGFVIYEKKVFML